MTSHFQFRLASLLHSRYLITFSLSLHFFPCSNISVCSVVHTFHVYLTFFIHLSIPSHCPLIFSHLLHLFFSLSLSVAINLIVQHIQDILSGDICKWQRGTANGHLPERILKRGVDETSNNPDGGGGSNPTKRPLLEPSTRPH